MMQQPLEWCRSTSRPRRRGGSGERLLGYRLAEGRPDLEVAAVIDTHQQPRLPHLRGGRLQVGFL
jgi:hypothetical protein